MKGMCNMDRHKYFFKRGEEEDAGEGAYKQTLTHLFQPGEVSVEVNGSLHAPSPLLPCLFSCVLMGLSASECVLCASFTN